MPAKALVAEAGDGVEGGGESAGQGCGAWISEPERAGSVALPCVGLVDALEERIADGTVLAGTLDDKQPPVDPAGFRDQLGEVLRGGAGR